jgi:hypothetical protein
VRYRVARRALGDAHIAAAYALVRDRFGMLWPLVLGFLSGTVSGALAYARMDMWCLPTAIVIVAAPAGWARHRARF